MTKIKHAELVWDPNNLTDRELAQIRRSSLASAKLLNIIVDEQNRRGLLSKPVDVGQDSLGSNSGYWPETVKRVGDYPSAQKSPRLF